VWADSDDGPPTNWRGAFGGSAWTFHEPTGQWYLHNFLRQQPDLNGWNEDVRAAFDDILRFWFDRGISGFRVDVCHMIVKDRELRDNPPATADDPPIDRARGQRQLYNADRPEVHDVLRRWRRIAEAYDPARLLYGETWLLDLERVAQYLGHDDELHLALDVPFILAPFEASALRTVVEGAEATVGARGWPVWSGSNHDVSRFPTRWCGGDPDKARCALMMLLTLRGTPILYYGDELGMPDTAVPPDKSKDPLAQLGEGRHAGRDVARTPMPWRAQPGAGFARAGVEPWLPFGDVGAYNVEDQKRDTGSVLLLARDLIALRRSSADLRAGGYHPVAAPEGVLAYRRGERTLIALNLADDPAALDGVDGEILLGTRRERDREKIPGRLSLAACEGVIALTP
jgi:alpha-glucosidase